MSVDHPTQFSSVFIPAKKNDKKRQRCIVNSTSLDHFFACEERKVTCDSAAFPAFPTARRASVGGGAASRSEERMEDERGPTEIYRAFFQSFALCRHVLSVSVGPLFSSNQANADDRGVKS